MRLNAVQKQAIIYSIKDKWMPAFKNGALGYRLTTIGSCFLCNCFHWSKPLCKKCPIGIKTKSKGCQDTPFENIKERREYEPKNAYVEAELRYLISFLPIEDQDIFHKEMEEA